MLVEFGATGSFDPTPEAAIRLNPSIILFAATALTLVGLLVGFVELVYLEKLFRNRSFRSKILYKLGLYTILMLIIISITYHIAASLELHLPIWHQQVWQRTSSFLGSLVFFSSLFQMGVSLLLCVLYAAISENLGHSVLVNLFTGRYHHPQEEVRIFMFLDMKSSTTIAEQLGHHRYFLLLRDFYDHLGPAIINNEGEVYQYIGDEVVISWKYSIGLYSNNCVNCFFSMKKALEDQSEYYLETYGLVPEFKAGLHYGQVTTGEIGSLKKEITFSGDVLNATARLQALCNSYSATLLVSGDLIKVLKNPDALQVEALGEISLKGRKQAMEVYQVKPEPSKASL